MFTLIHDKTHNVYSNCADCNYKVYVFFHLNEAKLLYIIVYGYDASNLPLIWECLKGSVFSPQLLVVEFLTSRLITISFVS